MEMSTQKKLKVAKMATQPIVAAIASENNTDKENGEDVKNEQTEQEDTGAEQQLPCGEATGTGRRYPPQSGRIPTLPVQENRRPAMTPGW